MDNSNILMHKVLAGLATPEEVLALESLVSSSASMREEFAELKFLYTSTDLPNDYKLKPDTSWHQIKVAIARIQSRTRIRSLIVVLVVSGFLYGLIEFVSAYWHQSITTDEPEPRLRRTIQFHDAPLREVITHLKDHDFDVSLSSQVAECKFTGAFSRGTKLKEVVIILAEVHHMNVRTTSSHSAALSGSSCID